MKELVLLKLFLAWSRARATHIKYVLLCLYLQVPVLFVGEGCMLAADHQNKTLMLGYPLINKKSFNYC